MYYVVYRAINNCLNKFLLLYEKVKMDKNGLEYSSLSDSLMIYIVFTKYKSCQKKVLNQLFECFAVEVFKNLFQ